MFFKNVLDRKNFFEHETVIREWELSRITEKNC